MSRSNISTISIARNNDKHIVITYYPLSLIILDTIFNLFTFAILCRPTFRDTNRRPTLHYMRAVAIFDILMLYGWNFDHYFFGAYGFTLLSYSIASCKFFSFLNYFTLQVSAWLRVFISLDRYLALSCLHKTWFTHSKNVLIIIASVITVFVIVNFHFFLFACFYKQDGTINANSNLYQIYPLWDFMNLGLYNCAPFICMVILNGGVIYHLVQLRQTSSVQNSRIQHRSISITSVITTLSFLVMTLPVNVSYAFFEGTAGYVLLHLFDSMLYTYHILSFPLYMITFTEFREAVFLLVAPNRQHRIHPGNLH